LIQNSLTFDTKVFFVGGAGMFLQYHDIVKPAYLYTVIKMILTEKTYGLPVDIIKDFSITSIIEWYKNRRYINPLKQLDWAHQIDPKELDKLLFDLMKDDESIYTLSPMLNVDRMFYVYRQQHMNFPVYVYSEHEEPFIKKDCQNIFQGINCQYLHGDLRKAIEKCDNNFTYIFSDIELAKEASEILTGTYSHVLVASDYRYNYIDNLKTFKYDLPDLMTRHPFIRLGTTTAMDMNFLKDAFENIT